MFLRYVSLRCVSRAGWTSEAVAVPRGSDAGRRVQRDTPHPQGLAGVRSAVCIIRMNLHAFLLLFKQRHRNEGTDNTTRCGESITVLI